MSWRRRDDVVVSAVFFSTFFGGSKPGWAVKRDTAIKFKDFQLRKWA